MFFNTYSFTFAFFPIVILGYYFLNAKGKYKTSETFLLIMSMLFYGMFDVTCVPIILASVLINFMLSKFIRKRTSKWLLLVGIVFNVLLLSCFKYTNFALSNIGKILSMEISPLNIIVPVGISFMTFQQISYLVDVYRDSNIQYNFREYALYVMFFPYVISGPIVRHNQLIPQLRDLERKKFNSEKFAKGIYAFVLGLGKKVLIADTFASVANIGFTSIEELNILTALIALLSYTIQIYFDFSGYSDMVTGIGYMLNFDMPINFNSPYKATNIMDFWKRWHMSLTSFLTEYVYYPLGGNRKGHVRTYINIFIVFLVSGIWHGASWGFILWGILHGMAQIVTRLFKKQIVKMNKILSWALVFAFINLTWVFFRANSISDAFCFLKAFLNFEMGAMSSSLLSQMIHTFIPIEVSTLIKVLFNGSSIVNIVFVLFAYLCVFICMIGAPNTNEKIETFKPDMKKALLIAFLFVWCVVSFSGVTSFIYVNF